MCAGDQIFGKTEALFLAGRDGWQINLTSFDQFDFARNGVAATQQADGAKVDRVICLDGKITRSRQQLHKT
jgi:hypothetical protein